MEFKDRLILHRESLGITKKRDMATLLGVGDSFYNMLESGDRAISKKILSKLVSISNKPETYWLYGIENEKEYLKSRNEFTSLASVIKTLKEVGYIKDGVPNEKGWELIHEGLLLDLKFVELHEKKQD